MAEQVKEDPSKYYWTEQDIQEGTIEKPTLVTPTRSFYLNKEHQLVLTFSQYEIAPGYMGTPEFVIPKSVTKRFWHRKIIWIIRRVVATSSFNFQVSTSK